MATLTRRVELLEQQMERLADLPARMTRVEEELDALRVEMRGEFDKVPQEIRSGDEETRNLMRILHEEVIERFKLLKEGIDRINGGPRDVKK